MWLITRFPYTRRMATSENTSLRISYRAKLVAQRLSIWDFHRLQWPDLTRRKNSEIYIFVTLCPCIHGGRNGCNASFGEIEKFADCILENYFIPEAAFLPMLWAQYTSATTKRTTNSCVSFHSKLNASFYSRPPSPKSFTILSLFFINF